jgi:hypothetical protein
MRIKLRSKDRKSASIIAMAIRKMMVMTLKTAKTMSKTTTKMRIKPTPKERTTITKAMLKKMLGPTLR